jgi:anti-sigma B factor antagonist
MASNQSANQCIEAAVSLTLTGRLDRQGSQWLQQQIQLLSSSDQKLWVLDMTAVDFIDSAGLVALVSALQMADQAAARLVLCGLKPNTKLILDITQLDRVFSVAESLESLLGPGFLQSLRVVHMTEVDRVPVAV